MSLRTAYQLSLLVDQLNSHLGYFDSNMERISALADAKNIELDALLQEEVDLEITQKVQVQLNENISLSASDVMNLRNFVEFVEAKDG